MMLAYIQAKMTGQEIDACLYNFGVYKSKKDDLNFPKIIIDHAFKEEYIYQGKKFPLDFYKNRKILLLARDPKDVLVSHYHFFKNRYGIIKSDINDFIKFKYNKKYFYITTFLTNNNILKYFGFFNFIICPFLNFIHNKAHKDIFIDNIGKSKYRMYAERFGLETIVNYLNSWVENKNSFADFRIFYYEDIRKEPFLSFKQMLEFLEIKCEDYLIKEAIEFASFENMRKIELEGSIKWEDLYLTKKENFVQQNFLMTRKGQVGSYKEELSQEMSEYIDNYIRDRLNNEFIRYKRA